MKFKSMLGNYVGYYADYIEIPYFRMIFIVIIFTAGLDFLEGILMNLLTLVFQGTGGIQRMLSLIGVRALYPPQPSPWLLYQCSHCIWNIIYSLYL